MKKIITSLMLLSLSKLMAQQTIIPTGINNATGTNGSTTYSIGQVDFINATGSTGSVTLGVHQPFEIVTLGTDDFPEINLVMKAFPNPTTANITLLIQNYNDENRSYQLLDVNGRMIESQKITQEETGIDLQNLAAAIYLLQISDDNKLLKTFKIIKN